MPKTALLEEKSSTSTSYWVRRALPAISHAKTTNNSARVTGETIGLYSGREEYDQHENNDVAQPYRICGDARSGVGTGPSPNRIASVSTNHHQWRVRRHLSN